MAELRLELVPDADPGAQTWWVMETALSDFEYDTNCYGSARVVRSWGPLTEREAHAILAAGRDFWRLLPEDREHDGMGAGVVFGEALVLQSEWLGPEAL